MASTSETLRNLADALEQPAALSAEAQADVVAQGLLNGGLLKGAILRAILARVDVDDLMSFIDPIIRQIIANETIANLVSGIVRSLLEKLRESSE